MDDATVGGVQTLATRRRKGEEVQMLLKKFQKNSIIRI
jgi:hypothetical protein